MVKSPEGIFNKRFGMSEFYLLTEFFEEMQKIEPGAFIFNENVSDEIR